MLVGRRELLLLTAAWSVQRLRPRDAAAVQTDARLLRVLPLGQEGRTAPPLETLLSSGINARLFTDLSKVTAERLVTPTRQFFVRTAAPKSLPQASTWTIRVGGLVRRPATIAIADLRSLAEPMGAHLIECAGNADPTNFGLMSAARWRGVPIGRVLDRVGDGQGASRVRVSGVDDPDPSPTSIPGAAWIFSRDELERAGAFLATSMNAEPLAPNHGAPVRLVVPGWYGCACIKWVDRIDLLDDRADATSQMREFARRTHQSGSPALAREFAPATIDHAATVVRLEQWLRQGQVEYRVVGIVWGGARPAAGLAIRFRDEEPFREVEDYPRPASTSSWSVWTHRWRPSVAGRYRIVLRVSDPGVRTRRLDAGFYGREVAIDAF